MAFKIPVFCCSPITVQFKMPPAQQLFSFLDEKSEHLMGQLCPVCLLRVYHRHKCINTDMEFKLLPWFKWDLTVLGCYTAEICSCFQTKCRSPIQGSAWTLKMGLLVCPKTLVTDYQSTLCNISEKRRSNDMLAYDTDRRCYQTCVSVSFLEMLMQYSISPTTRKLKKASRIIISYY
jgi:hypothetical protein